MNYLFISGAPRSGTSALTELLASHNAISLGMERFKYLYGKGQVTKELFEKENFFNFSEAQTNINNVSGKYVDYYTEMEKKYAGSQVVGDKYPQLYKAWGKLEKEFVGQSKFVFIVRDIEDVASSFNVRAQNTKDSWPQENDYKRAVEIWNQSLLKAKEKLARDENIFIVYYKDLFDNEEGSPQATLGRMLEYLQLDHDEALASALRVMSKKYSDSVKFKAKLVLEGQESFIEQNANYKLFRELLGR